MSFGGGSVTDPMTARGRSWPCLRQFGVFLENRVGRLHDLLRHLEGHQLRVIALSVSESTDCAVARLMLSNYERGREVLDLSQFAVFECDVIGVELPDADQPYVAICMALLEAEVNIHYTYPLLYRREGRGGIALYVDEIDLALTTLQNKGHRIITETDLFEQDEFS